MSAEELAKALEAPMYCEECEHVERDPIMLDAERCSRCGGILAGMDDDDELDPDRLREDRDERQRLVKD